MTQPGDDLLWMPSNLDFTQWTRQPGLDGDFVHVAAVTAAPKETKPAELTPREETSGQSVCRFPLYPFQSECVLGVESALQGKLCTAPLIVLPCGSGKTIVSSAIMQRSMTWPFRAYQEGHRSGALFIAHRKELLDQTVEKVRLVADELRVGVVQASRNDLGRHITVASIATLAAGNRLDDVIASGPYHLIVIDEAHHAVSKTWRKVIARLREAFPEAFLLGMTATPGRADGTALDLVFDAVAYSKSIEWMINHGYLVPPRGLSVKLDVNLEQVETENGDFVQSQLSKVMNTDHVNLAVVRAWQEHGNDAKMLAFCVDVAHAHALAKMFRDEGYTAVAVDGKTKQKDREKALADFRSGAIRILCSCDLFTEGYDDPSAEGVLLCRPTQSQGLHVQSVGRGLRRFPGKTECLVLDCVGNTSRHRLAQLATIAGLDPENKLAGGRGGSLPEWMRPPEEPEPVVTDASVESVREVQLTGVLAMTKYQWRQTTAGFALRIPRVGYYLVTPDDDAPHKAFIKFFDRRKEREHSAPRTIMGPIEMEMAYTLVEADLDRLRRASSESHWTKGYGAESESEAHPTPSGMFDFGEGIDFVPEEWFLKDQSWHTNPITEKQTALLRKLGVKQKSMPESAGEASELIDVLQMEKDIRNSQGATANQKWYIRQHSLPVPMGTSMDTLTRAQAQRIIVQHRIQSAKGPPA
jgi:superfamily II DNA or RNA helicase